MKITVELDCYTDSGDLIDGPIIITDASEAGDDMVMLKRGCTVWVFDAKELMEALSKFV